MGSFVLFISQRHVRGHGGGHDGATTRAATYDSRKTTAGSRLTNKDAQRTAANIGDDAAAWLPWLCVIGAAATANDDDDNDDDDDDDDDGNDGNVIDDVAASERRR